MNTYATLISATELQSLLLRQKTEQTEQSVRVFDCSFELSRPQAGAEMFAQSHIPGAVYAHLDRDLSAAKDPATGKPVEAVSGGRHPLPTRATFAAWLGSVGFTHAMQAVVYDRQGANFCGRLWWMFKWLGHENVAVLDGGLQAWQAVGGAVVGGPASQYLASHFVPGPALCALVDTQAVADALGHGAQTLIDARGAPRFRGDEEPLDPVAGHIPGALNRPFGQNMDSSGCFKPAHQLKAEFLELLGERDPASVVHQCGSGVSAVPNIIAMEVAGLGRSALYAGSWSAWCADPNRPVARG
ncbi:MAG: sulfurtransferase [Rhodoferax sp.]|nr:sulfurtransferase [Rhodoferax sp.]